MLSGKFPPEDREYRIIGNPLLARLFDKIFSISGTDQASQMELESHTEIFDSVKRDIELAAIRDYWGGPSDQELAVRVRDLISPFSAAKSTEEDLVKLFHSIACWGTGRRY